MTRPHLLLSLAISVLCALILAVVTAAVRFQVRPDGLRTFNSYGRWRVVPWGAVSAVKPARYYFLPHLRLSIDGSRSPSWIPLFLSDMAAFRQAVITHAGATHPIARALPIPATATTREDKA